MEKTTIIAERIKESAKNRGKSVRDVLITCGVGVNTVQKLSKGQDINSNTLAKIADALDCSVDYLLGRDTGGVANSFNGDITLGDIGSESSVKVNVADFGEKETSHFF